MRLERNWRVSTLPSVPLLTLTWPGKTRDGLGGRGLTSLVTGGSIRVWESMVGGEDIRGPGRVWMDHVMDVVGVKSWDQLGWI